MFISYQWSCQDEVIKIKTFLEKSDIDVWFDRTNLICTEGSLHSQYSKGIEESELFVCFITKNYDASKNCNLEISWASELQKKMIVVMVEEIEMRNLKNIGIFIASRLRINYFNNKDPKNILDEILKVIFLA